MGRRQALPCGDRTRPPRAGAAHTTLCLVGVTTMLTLLGLWWDSSPQGVSPKALVAKLFIHSTHSYLTEWAIDKLKGQWPEIEQYRKKIIEGANTEMHADDENAQGTKYGINLPDKAKNAAATTLDVLTPRDTGTTAWTRIAPGKGESVLPARHPTPHDPGHGRALGMPAENTTKAESGIGNGTTSRRWGPLTGSPASTTSRPSRRIPSRRITTRSAKI